MWTDLVLPHTLSTLEKEPPGRLHVLTQCVSEERQLSNKLSGGQI